MTRKEFDKKFNYTDVKDANFYEDSICCLYCEHFKIDATISLNSCILMRNKYKIIRNHVFFNCVCDCFNKRYYNYIMEYENFKKNKNFNLNFT
jgi:hypothetical protein